MRASGQRTAAGLTALAVVLAAPTGAGAEQVFTSQAAAARAGDATWAPAPTAPAAVCLVDTGVDENADTGNVVARVALDDEPPTDVDTAGHHGTLMAMIASAPPNGFGMVGLAPSVHIVSVRAARAGQPGFSFGDIRAGIRRCKQLREAYNIRVVSLSLGAAGPVDPGSLALLENAIDTVRAAGLNVVAAAGNGGGAPDLPAAYPPVLAVGAATTGGAPCSFSATGADVDLYAPGCPLDVALPDGQPASASGTSEAAVLVAAALAQLRGLRPDLDAAGAEALLVAGASRAGGVPALDVDAAFRAAGLHDALALGHAAIPAPAPSASSESVVVASSPPGRAGAAATVAPAAAAVSVSGRRLAAPRIARARYRRGTLTLTLLNRPRGAVAQLDVYARRRGRPFPVRVRRLRTTRRRVALRVRGVLTQVTVTFVDGRRRSATRSLRRWSR